MAKLNLLFVVHRYVPYPGGSEYYVQAMAEECLRRGHTVTVYTDVHKGDWNGVTVTGDIYILMRKYDLIVVHGGDVSNQNNVHMHAHILPSPVLYLLISPSASPVCLKGLRDAKWLGCSTQADWKFCKQHGQLDKAVEIKHGIKYEPFDADKKRQDGETFREKWGIKTKFVMLATGGFWQHKGFEELCQTFLEAELKDWTLVMTGYHQDARFEPRGAKDSLQVIVLYLEERADVKLAMSAADLIVMNSFQEGFGLVLLEAMSLKVPWIARGIAGALTLQSYGTIYKDRAGLQDLLEQLKHDGARAKLLSLDQETAYSYLEEHHSIRSTCNSILALAQEGLKK